MEVGKLEAVVGQSPAQMRQAVRAFLDSYKDIEKDKLNNDLERISKVINELKKVEGLEPEVTRLQILQSDVYLAVYQEYLAAKALMAIDFTNDNCGLTYTDIIDKQLNICEYMIKSDDSTNCLPSYIKLKGIKWDELKKKQPAQAEFLYIRYKLIEAEYMKENDKGLEALMVYVNALGSSHLKDYPDQLEQIFDKAVIAALFSAGNEKRVGLLASLCEDPICGRSKCRNILDKLMKGGLMFVEDVQTILPKLRDWQKREDHDFVSPLEYAVFEHNLTCLTSIYDIVSIKTLLSLLHMKQVKVYMLLERMIRNNKLQAEIDTVDGFVTFTQNKSSEKDYNARINQFCSSLKSFIDANSVLQQQLEQQKRQQEQSAPKPAPVPVGSTSPNTK